MGLWFSVNVSDSRGFRRALLIPLFGALLAGSVVAPAGAAPASCENPGTAGEFTQVPAADLGFDAATLQQAVDFGTAKASTSRSEEHTSELQSLMRNSYAVFCSKKKT